MIKPQESVFEEAITAHLIDDGGYQRLKWGTHPETSADFDRDRGIDTAELYSFVEDSQPDAWKALVKSHGGEASAKTKFLQRLAQQLDQRGTLEVLREGVMDQNVQVRLAFFKPAHGLTAELVRRYESNRLTVTRQLPYKKDSTETLDVGLFVNGIPVATAELKNPLTGQNVEHAVRQYRRDRDPRNVTLGRRALVHFAVDPDRVAMTTRLAGEATRFLPFNKGNDGGAGNPLNPDGHRTSYLWERVWTRDAWLDLLARFIHVETASGDRVETVIFPRFHQWDAVLRMEDDVRESGAGKSYLVQHSAGSGKSNTIAWTAHRLSNLHDASDTKVFDKVIVVTDRVVLDRQLQDTIFQFEHVHGVVVKIDKDSSQLAKALAGEEARVIITTLQKFPFVLRHIEELPDRRYAIIVDEAHSSQSGEAAHQLRVVLGADEDTELTAAEAEDRDFVADPIDPVEEALAKGAGARGRQENLSYFAFTATPKAKTLELFGKWDAEEKTYRPFHLYTMRQAIEEQFILDVLRNYTTYETFWRVEKRVGEDPSLDPRKTRREIGRFVSLHPHNLAQRAEIIIEHFRQHTAAKIGGQAKAMVVSSSRLHAVRYKQALDRYIKNHAYSNLRTLVAFSGTVVDGDDEYTEPRMNGFPESQTADVFGGADYQVLVVAEKFQTGFDQPLLHTMYVDKVLLGLAAVQTLSRLNRIHPLKEDTFILDFRNDAEEIREAFEPYYGMTEATPTDPNLLWDTRQRIDAFDVLRPTEVEAAVQVLVTLSDASGHGRIHALLDPAAERYRALAEDDAVRFKDALDKFVRTYSFLAQVVVFSNPSLERDYLYCRALAAVIREPADNERLDVGAMVELSHLRTEVTFAGSVSLRPADQPLVWQLGEGSGRQEEPEPEALSDIVAVLNGKFGADLTENDQLLFDQFENDWASDEELQAQAQSNRIENFRYPFERKFMETIVRRLDVNGEIAKRILDDPAFRGAISEFYLDKVYTRLQGPSVPPLQGG